MFVAMTRLHVTPPYAAFVEGRFHVGRLENECGFLRHVLLRPTTAEQPYIVMTFWETENDFERWHRSEPAIEGGARLQMLPRDAFRDRGSLETFEAFADSAEPCAHSQRR